MKQIRKFAAIAITAVCLTGVLGACGSSDDKKATVQTADQTSDQTMDQTADQTTDQTVD